MTATTLTKRETLINARNEWDTRNAEQKAKHNAQYAEFNRKQGEVFADIECKVLFALDGIDLPLIVEVNSGLSIRRNNVVVRIKSNENRVHAEDKALSWTWDVSLNESDEPQKNSSSWSGLQATTAQQIDSLKATVQALEILNNIDWSDMLNVTLPDYKDYVTEPSSIGQRPKFEADIRTAEIAELIGENKIIKGSPTGGRGRGTAWYLIVSESAKQFKVAEIPDYSVQEKYLQERGITLAKVVGKAKDYTIGITKEKFINDILGKMIETMEF